MFYIDLHINIDHNSSVIRLTKVRNKSVPLVPVHFRFLFAFPLLKSFPDPTPTITPLVLIMVLYVVPPPASDGTKICLIICHGNYASSFRIITNCIC